MMFPFIAQSLWCFRSHHGSRAVSMAAVRVSRTSMTRSSRGVEEQTKF